MDTTRQLPGQPGTPGTPPDGGIVGVITAAGAIIVVGLGLVFVFVLTIVGMNVVPEDQRSTLVTAAFTVIGTVVGTYFGVRAGSAGKERAEAARDLESVKVQELAAHVNPDVARQALDKAEQRAAVQRSQSSTTIQTL
jgi:hypothetical protein